MIQQECATLVVGGGASTTIHTNILITRWEEKKIHQPHASLNLSNLTAKPILNMTVKNPTLAPIIVLTLDLMVLYSEAQLLWGLCPMVCSGCHGEGVAKAPLLQNSQSP